jgi:hypothetical protein
MKVEQIKGAFRAAIVGSWSAREITAEKAKTLLDLAEELSDESWLKLYEALNYAIAQSERVTRKKVR